MDVAAQHQRWVFRPRKRPDGDCESRSSTSSGNGKVVRLWRFGKLGCKLLAGDGDPYKYVPRATTVALGIPGRELFLGEQGSEDIQVIVMFMRYLREVKVGSDCLEKCKAGHETA